MGWLLLILFVVLFVWLESKDREPRLLADNRARGGWRVWAQHHGWGHFTVYADPKEIFQSRRFKEQVRVISKLTRKRA